jgi:hypothetical protein
MSERTPNDGDHAGQLQTLIAVRGQLSEFEALLTGARNALGSDAPISIEIEYECEIRRDGNRSARHSMPIWNELRDRADRALAPDSRVAQDIRAHHLHQMRACGRPEDLDRIVELCREEIGRRPTGPPRSDLAWALRDRAWFGRYAWANGHDPKADLDEALELIDDEVGLRRTAHDPVATTVAELIRVEVLLARVPLEPAAAAEALASVRPLVAPDGPGFDSVPPPQVLQAEALAATGSHEDAVGVARRVYAIQGTGRAFDPARPLLTVARSTRRDNPRVAETAARTALDQRGQTFATDSHYALEAQALLESLLDGHDR